MIKNPVFKTLFWGKVNPHKITIKKKSVLLKRNKESEKFLENEWKKQVEAGLKTKPDDLKPTRYHFGGLKMRNNSIEILADPAISYRDAIGSRPEKFRKLFKKEYWPTSLTVTMALLTKNKNGDEFLVITLRNPNHDHKAGGFHVTAGGAMEINKDIKPIDTALRETQEECGINAEELSDTFCGAVIYNPWLLEIGTIFISTANIPTEKIQRRSHDPENKIAFIPMTKNSLEYWLLELTHANSIDGIVGMLIIGEKRYGKEWKEKMLAKFIRKNQWYSNPQKRNQLEKMDIKKLKILLR